MAGSAQPNRTPKPQLPPFAGLPDLPAMRELQSRPKWVAWEYTWNDDRGLWDKPPLNAKNGGAGSTTNAATWAPYDAAAAFATRRVQAGVGYVLSPEDEESGVDLDDCRDPETGVLQAWAQVAVDFGETYAEVSPSGCGLRFFVRGRVDGRKVDAAQVEIYTGGRYLTVTGRHVAGTPTEIHEAPRLIAYLQEQADRIKAAQKTAADLARQQERKNAEKRAQEPPKQTTSERASASARERGPRDGSDFWRTVNDRALANLAAWVTNVFPGARYQSGTGAYRVDQRDLGEGYEEDMSLHPDGIRDFGVGDMGDARDGARSPIDVVRDYLPTQDAASAAMWLCDRLGTRPEDIGWKGGQRNEGERPRAEASAEAEPPSERKRIRATPFAYRDPKTIPPREWIYGRHLIRRFLSTTVAPGASGKSSLVLVEAVAMATGRALLGIKTDRPMSVWYVNLEDPMEEIERRVAAICLHYEIDAHELEGKLFLDSGRTAEIIIATKMKDGVKIAEPVIEDLIGSIVENKIDHMVVDPFVSSHRVTENANDEIDIVAKAWNRVAEIGNASIELVHHVRKGQAGQGEFTVEDGRGAGALLAAARSARVLNVMTKDQAEKAGAPTNRGFFRVDNGKANLAPPPDKSDWFQLVSVSLGNGPGDQDNPLNFNAAGDHVAVVAPWEWPDAFEGVGATELRAAQSEVDGCIAAGTRFRLNVQSPNWVGVPIARALKLDAQDKSHRSKISRMLRVWIETGMFVVVEGKDEKRRPRDYVEVGKHASDAGE